MHPHTLHATLFMTYYNGMFLHSFLCISSSSINMNRLKLLALLFLTCGSQYVFGSDDHADFINSMFTQVDVLLRVIVELHGIIL